MTLSRITSWITIAGTLLSAASLAHAQVYKWVDEHGVTHYESSAPASSVKAKTLDIPTAPAPSDSSNQSWQEKDSAFQARYDKRKAQEAKDDAAQQKAKAARMSSCLHAQVELQNIQRAASVFQVDAQGNRHNLSDEQREQEIVELRQTIANSCG